MNNSELIENAYAEAVKGINVEWLYGSSTKWYEYIIRLPDHLKFTYLIVLMDNQVFNGGLHQYFSNRYGQFAEESVKALVEIGTTKKSELLKKAYQVVNASNVSPDQLRKLLLEMNMPSLF